MKKLLICLAAMAMVGCAAGSNFTPKTQAGARCKVQCSQNMSMCQGSSYTCDRAAATCMKSCEELDAVSK
jgi:hypothetical protein